mmetsp:Transcript_5730/g.14668  ORF Transcript_5730/g.14668 Transcript_5730/m.14668 type:complete len:279 (-) Transcript_5730:77-913(-)
MGACASKSDANAAADSNASTDAVVAAPPKPSAAADTPAAQPPMQAAAPPASAGFIDDVIVSADDLPMGKLVVHVGPLEIDSDGVVAKPKFNVGFTNGTLSLMAGMRDLRNGLAVEGLAMAVKSYSIVGSSLIEVLSSVQANEHLPVLDDLVAAVPQLVADVLDATAVDVDVPGVRVEGVIYVYTGVGVTAGLYLGWLDTSGYAMVGAEGKVASALGMGATLRAGVHEDGASVRIVVYMANVGVDVIVRFPASRDSVATQPAPSQPGAAAVPSPHPVPV